MRKTIFTAAITGLLVQALVWGATSFLPSTSLKGLLVDTNGSPYTIGTAGAAGSFNPSNSAQVLLVDTDGNPYKASTGTSGGGLVLVSNQTLSSAATDLTFSSLDGNTDGVYKLNCHVKMGADTNTVSLLPNNSASNLTFKNFNSGGTGSGSNWNLVTGQSTGFTLVVSMDFYAKNNPNAQAFGRQIIGTLSNATTSAADVAAYSGFWNDTTTNLTSLVVHSSQTNGLASGTTCQLYKYAQS